MGTVGSADGVPGRVLSVRVAVRNPMVAEALSATAARVGWRETVNEACEHMLVSDRVPARRYSARSGNNLVVVCEPTPWGAREALDAVASLLATSVVCADQPADLARALAAVLEEAASIPIRVLDLAGEMPLLTERQMLVLGGVLAGQSNTAICEGLYVSVASVKRDLTCLYSAFGASTRSSLVAEAARVGVPSQPVLP